MNAQLFAAARPRVEAKAPDGERALSIMALVVFSWANVTGPGRAGWPGALLALGLLAVASMRSLRFETQLVAIVAAMSCWAAAISLPAVWPLYQLLLLAPVLALVVTTRRFRSARAWLVKGRVEAWPAVAMAGVAAVALPIWLHLAKPDLGGMHAMMPAWSLPALVGAAAFFSLANAVLEELLFRGLLQPALAELWGAGPRAKRIAIVGQAVAFGMMHWFGFPSGPLGALLAGVWALMLGWARDRSGGLATPVLSHIVADAVIFASLYATAP